MADTATLSNRSICGARPSSRTTCCIQVPSKIVHDPDPSIYDQQLVFNTGGAPTFDSPDISTQDLWPPTPASNLGVTVRNLSTVASANQTRVDLSWSVWGIGMPRTAIGSTFVNLARAGFAGSQISISIPTPPALTAAALFGLFVNLVHPYDSNPNNNAGEQTVNGFQTSKGGRSQSFVVPVINPTSSAQTINLTAGPASVAPWTTILPATFTLGAGAQQNVTVSIAVPAAVPVSPPGTLFTAEIDVIATIGGVYLGGVNIAVLVDA
ncbi:MAG: hypothetical protein ABSE51_04420 [Terracidiphilus sp.]